MQTEKANQTEMPKPNCIVKMSTKLSKLSKEAVKSCLQASKSNAENLEDKRYAEQNQNASNIVKHFIIFQPTLFQKKGQLSNKKCFFCGERKREKSSRLTVF